MASIEDTKFCLVWVVISLLLTHHGGVEGVQERLLFEQNDEQDLELEKQLKILNKPAVKIIQSEWGDFFDCIDINKQPAFDHPSLQNHKIQMKPSLVRKKIMKDETFSGTTKLKPASLGRVRGCPRGTIPIRKTSKEDLVRAKSLSDRYTIKRNLYRAGVIYDRLGQPFYGASAGINVYNPSITQYQYTTATVAIESGPHTIYNGIRIGWMVSTEMYGDNKTRIYAFWTSDGGETGCYNTLCPGFVQVHSSIPLGTIMNKISVYQGIQYFVKAQVYQDKITKNWWLELNDNITIGYWPKSLFNILSGGGERVFWGGVVLSGDNGISPQMGSGVFPNGKYNEACFFINIQTANDTHMRDPQDDKIVQILDCQQYGLQYYGYKGENNGHTFLFGGPGGKCG